MKHIFIVLFILVSFHSYAQKYFYHETSFDKMNGVVESYFGDIKYEFNNKIKQNKIFFYSNKTLTEKIDSANCDEYFNKKAQILVNFDSLYFYDEIDPIEPLATFNKIRIEKNGFEFILNTKLWCRSLDCIKTLKDTDISIFYINNENLNKLTDSPIGKSILFHYQNNLREVKEISTKTYATFLVDMQREMLNPEIRKYVKRIEGFEYKNLDSTMSNELSNLRYFKYTKRFDPSLALDDVIRNSKMIIDYDMDSKSGKFILNGIGFDFCPGECMRGGVYYPYYQFSVEPENFKSVFSAHDIDLIYLLIDSYVNRMNCDN
jgi:hypothetical protein